MRSLLAPALMALAACAAVPDLYDDLERRMREGDAESRIEARNRIIELGGPRAVAIFERNLGEDAGETRFLAIPGLASLCDTEPRAMDLLLPLLTDRSRQVRLETFYQLAYFNDPRLAPRIIERCADEDPEIRKVAVDWLADRPAESSRGIFQRGLSDSDPEVRKEAARGLASLDWFRRAAEIRYHEAKSTPYPKGSKKEAEYLKAHHAGWDQKMLWIQEEALENGKIVTATGTCCEAVETVTKGWYAGAHDASAFLAGLEKRAALDASVISRLKAYRLDVERHPVKDWYLPDR